MELNFKWKENKRMYGDGESLYLNRIRLGECGWNSMRPKDSNVSEYSGSIALPSLKSNRVFGDTIEDVKAELEKMATNWFNEALKEVNNDSK